MTYRKEIEINHQHSLGEHEIIELLNALSSQAAYARAFRAHAIETTGIDPANLKKVVKRCVDQVEPDDLVFSKLEDLHDMIVDGYPMTYEGATPSCSPRRFLPLSTPSK